MPFSRRPILLYALLVLVLVPPPAAAEGLDDELGRNEVRVLSAPFPVHPGTTVTGAALPERLERLGYTRVGERPNAPGEYFWGHEVFWIYRREHRIGAQEHSARLFDLVLDDGRVTGFRSGDGEALWPDGRFQPWLEPEVLAEGLSGDRARTVRVELDGLPEHVWRTVLAAEDHRFFDHAGLDWRGIARALLQNALAGEVTQGGSTITQQLVKLRDLTPRRTLGRQASEAVRALALEAEYDKREILESYLDHVYYGHAGGLGVYGLGTAAGTLVAAVWVGIDDGSPLGVPGSEAAAPIWRAFVEPVAASRPPVDRPTPEDVVVRWVEDSTGRLVEHRRSGAHSELFDRDHLPPARRLLLPDPPVIE